jgi:hypothetical protein
LIQVLKLPVPVPLRLASVFHPLSDIITIRFLDFRHSEQVSFQKRKLTLPAKAMSSLHDVSEYIECSGLHYPSCVQFSGKKSPKILQKIRKEKIRIFTAVHQITGPDPNTRRFTPGSIPARDVAVGKSLLRGPGFHPRRGRITILIFLIFPSLVT